MIINFVGAKIRQSNHICYSEMAKKISLIFPNKIIFCFTTAYGSFLKFS